jgi:hypothetical protein
MLPTEPGENDRCTVIQRREVLLHGEQGSLHIDVAELVEVHLGDLPQKPELTEAGVGEYNVDSSA